MGNAYDTHSGIFTCPMDGVYVFHWTILTVKGKYFYTDFKVNGKVVGRSHPNAVEANRAASSSVVYHMKKNDKAWIEPLSHHNGLYAFPGWSFFSGYRLYA
ncbi:hypothetical protein FSP39_024102 [Pinctada imbricata]|uniref:C1q domain-containing protein n=1 Tax=Pinctada imbricata TaxID=66713 RepID=A0AA88XGG4_PINIB|nr:hypothetical protein FSP39_024102 [Pinctada imbricata]